MYLIMYLYHVSMLSLIFTAALNASTTSTQAQKKKSITQQHKRSQTFTFFDTSETPATASYYNYIIANYNHKSGSVQGALKAYQRLLAKNPSIYIYEGYISLLFDIGLFSKLITTIEAKKQELEPLLNKNLNLQLIIAQAYLYADKDEEASKHFLALSNDFPNNEQVAYYSIIAHIKKNNTEKALTEISKNLANDELRSKHFLFHFLSSKIYLQQNKIQEAQVAIDKSLELFPKFDRGWLFKAILMEQQGNINDAIHGYQRFLSLVGREEAIEKQLIQLLFNQQKYAEAAGYLERIENNSAEYFFDLALIYSKANNIKKALEAIDKSVAKNPALQKAHLLKIEILAQHNKSEDVLQSLEKWMNQPNNDQQSLHMLMLLKQQMLKPIVLIKALERLIENKKGSEEHQALLADLYSEEGNHRKALTHYQALLESTKNVALSLPLHVHIAHEYFALKQHAQAEEVLEKALAFNQPHPSLYNMLAYHYAKNKKNIDKALHLIDQAITLQPFCSHYLDTKGYILLQQGNKDEARQLFKEALALSPNDSVIKKHLKRTE